MGNGKELVLGGVGTIKSPTNTTPSTSSTLRKQGLCWLSWEGPGENSHCTTPFHQGAAIQFKLVNSHDESLHFVSSVQYGSPSPLLAPYWFAKYTCPSCGEGWTQRIRWPFDPSRHLTFLGMGPVYDLFTDRSQCDWYTLHREGAPAGLCTAVWCGSYWDAKHQEYDQFSDTREPVV